MSADHKVVEERWPKLKSEKGKTSIRKKTDHPKIETLQQDLQNLMAAATSTLPHQKEGMY